MKFTIATLAVIGVLVIANNTGLLRYLVGLIG